MLLSTQQALVNLGICAALLCAHCCPFQQTVRKYPNYHRKTSVATTGNNGLGQAEEVHYARHDEFIHVHGRWPHLLHHLHRVWDTPLLKWQALVQLRLSAISEVENPPNMEWSCMVPLIAMVGAMLGVSQYEWSICQPASMYPLCSWWTLHGLSYHVGV